MIKIENTHVYNIAVAVYSARNAMRSWEKSDSNLIAGVIGENDLALAKKLVKAGTDHRKFLRQIMVSVDITAPLYWWKEYDTYKVGTVANSESTMHTITSKPFEYDDFSWEHVGIVPNCDPAYQQAAETVIEVLNEARHCYLDTKDKAYWWQIIQLLPTSYNQMRTCTLNYEVILNQYHARCDHKLDEWHSYCDWEEELPYFREICLED